MSWQLVVLVKPLQDELPDHEVLTGSNNARLPKSRTSLQTDICLLGAPVFPPPCPAVLEGKARINFSPTYEIGIFHCPFFYDSGPGSFFFFFFLELMLIVHRSRLQDRCSATRPTKIKVGKYTYKRTNAVGVRGRSENKGTTAWLGRPSGTQGGSGRGGRGRRKYWLEWM